MGNDLTFKVKIMDDVAPGILLEDDSRSIAKGLTSKTDRVLSKTSLGASGHYLAGDWCSRSGGLARRCRRFWMCDRLNIRDYPLLESRSLDERGLFIGSIHRAAQIMTDRKVRQMPIPKMFLGTKATGQFLHGGRKHA
jgi:hypothetical protein